MTTKEILIAARKLIAKPKGWTKGTLETEYGSVCAVGALSRAAGYAVPNYDGSRFQGARSLLNEVAGGDIVDYNDSHSKKCVVAAFDAAIERAS